ncbi:MAG: hypothetical protein EBU01_09170 [Crocinitomicaceae bacterium]|nr:hypothetical protein [Crocinitomicaceae bacterium]NCA22394.1 hypothetical protein [Crocinitomicaceae bacterium]
MSLQPSINVNDEINIKKINLPNFILFKNKKKPTLTKKTFQPSSNENQTEKCCKKKITFTNSWKNMQQSTSILTSTNNIQLFYLNNLNIFFHSTSNNNNALSSSNVANNELNFEYGTLLLNEIKKKLQGYKQQDIKKHIYDKVNFCDISTTIHLLTDTNLICHYCKENMKIIYDDVKDEKQWTLDRIDNNIGHNNNNVLICCLKCNLKRRKQNVCRFHFAEKMKKQLIIERIE